MTPPRQKTPRAARVAQAAALVAASILGLFVMNTLQSDSSSQAGVGLSTASLFTIPADETPTAMPTALATTPPLAIPTATAEPTATAVPATPTAVPTATTAPTALPASPAESAPPPAVSVAESGRSAADEEAPLVAPTAVPASPATATAVPAPPPTATSEPTPQPTPTVVPFDVPTATPLPTLPPAPTATVIPVQTTADLELYVLSEINDVRARAGLGALALDPFISDIARDWSQQMATGGFFFHRPGDELSAMLPSGWRQWGENIASAPDIFWAQSSLEQSPGHYANMVGSFTHVGIGVYSTGDQVWVTQNFVRY